MFSLQKCSRAYRATCYAFAALLAVAVLMTAFYSGLAISVTRTDVADAVVKTDELPTDQEEPTEELPAPVATGEGIQVDWNMGAGEPRDFNFYLRRLWEAEFRVDDTAMDYDYEATVLGQVMDGDHAGDVLVAETVFWDKYSLGGGATTFYVIESQKDDLAPVILTRYVWNEPSFHPFTSAGDNVEAILATIRANDSDMGVSDAKLAGVDANPVVTDTNGNNYTLLGKGARLTEEARTGIADYPVRATLTDGTELREYVAYGPFSGMPGTLFQEHVDGRLAFYDLDLSFWGDDATQPESPTITWNSGANYPDGYLKSFVGGCGTIAPTQVVYDLDESSVARTGTIAQTREPVYEYRDYAASDDYRNWQFTHQENAPSYESFVASHPSFFYKDALGRWIKFTGSSVLPPGECGKPVIYLYPTATTDLTVTLAPQGGFTKSEPAYDNGWNVTASPNGSLVNKADGLVYPYLFWEGRGGYYSAPTKYWVVAKNEVHAFLVSTLAKLGLNAKETTDFLEFWEPRMQSSSFYKIGFHGTSVMNQIAPFTVSQTPDTVVRILMDYAELSAPIPANPPTLPATPVRKGFTLIEWGGVIR